VCALAKSDIAWVQGPRLAALDPAAAETGHPTRRPRRGRPRSGERRAGRRRRRYRSACYPVSNGRGCNRAGPAQIRGRCRQLSHRGAACSVPSVGRSARS
jgi:hypothetical protein